MQKRNWPLTLPNLKCKGPNCSLCRYVVALRNVSASLMIAYTLLDHNPRMKTGTVEYFDKVGKQLVHAEPSQRKCRNEYANDINRITTHYPMSYIAAMLFIHCDRGTGERSSCKLLCDGASFLI